VLTDGEISQMRTQLERTLPDTAVIQRRTLASDGQGGSVETWAPIGTASCRISPVNLRGDLERERADSMAEERPRVVTLPADTTIEGRDRIVIADTTYEVTHVDGPRSYELARRVDVVEVR
jgi:SPP1 family predicted phage head-tail adaptor